jgi:hypothetical protein
MSSDFTMTLSGIVSAYACSLLPESVKIVLFQQIEDYDR